MSLALKKPTHTPLPPDDGALYNHKGHLVRRKRHPNGDVTYTEISEQSWLSLIFSPSGLTDNLNLDEAIWGTHLDNETGEPTRYVYLNQGHTPPEVLTRFCLASEFLT